MVSSFSPAHTIVKSLGVSTSRLSRLESRDAAPINQGADKKQKDQKIDDIMFVSSTRPAGQVDEDETTSTPTGILKKFLNMWWRGVFAASVSAQKSDPEVWGSKALAALNRYAPGPKP
jgi:hypothetical protein